MKRQKVLAFVTGEIQQQTEKAINIEERWFPKSAIENQYQTNTGSTAFVIKAWFIRKEQWLVKNVQGIGITKSVQLQDGTLLFQGDIRKATPQQELPFVTFDTMEIEVNMLVTAGTDELEAVKQIRRKYQNYQKVEN